MPLSGRKVNQAEGTKSTKVPVSLLGMFKEWEGGIGRVTWERTRI